MGPRKQQKTAQCRNNSQPSFSTSINKRIAIEHFFEQWAYY